MSEDKDVRLAIRCELNIKPSLIYTMAVNILVKADYEGVIVRKRVCQIQLTCRAVAWQGVGTGEDIIPSSNARGAADIMITTNGIDADTSIVNRLHRVSPRGQLAFQGCLVDPTVNQIAGKKDKIDVLIDNLSGNFAQNCSIYAIITATAVADSDECPRLCKTHRGKYRTKKQHRNKLYCISLFHSSPIHICAIGNYFNLRP